MWSLFKMVAQYSNREVVFARYYHGNRGLRGVLGPIGPTGPRGSKGRKGDAGSGSIDDVCRWMPKLVLGEFQVDELCCFALANPHRDVLVGIGGVITTRISQSTTKKNAVAIKR